LEFGEFCNKFLGEEKVFQLKRMANTPKSYATYELEELLNKFSEIKEGQWKA
jgi:hypothetical protein